MNKALKILAILLLIISVGAIINWLSQERQLKEYKKRISAQKDSLLQINESLQELKAETDSTDKNGKLK